MTIAVLLSTYNGEKYISEQIKSIQSQTNNDWHLYIRDDGSTDNTVNIIRQFSQSDNRISFINQDKIINLGVTKSFFSLLGSVHADYYMFCDQDDRWMNDKIESALRLVQRNEPGPICLHTEIKVVDENLKFKKLMVNDNHWTNFRRFIFGNCLTGCTMMINNALKQELHLDTLNMDDVVLHDWWIALVASQFGKIVYDPTSHILYRQHGGNVVGYVESSTVSSEVSRASDTSGDLRTLINCLKMMREYRRLYLQKLSGKDYQYVDRYGQLLEKSSLSYNFWSILTVPPKRTHLKGQLFFSYLLVRYNKRIGMKKS